jgi:hypothetical protein
VPPSSSRSRPSSPPPGTSVQTTSLPTTPTERTRSLPPHPEWIPDHLARLRRHLPEAALPLATPDLVFLYRIDNSYVGLFEGVFPRSCPQGTDWPCVATALRREIDVITGSEQRRGSDLMEVKAPEGAQILYRGEPGSGPIGVASYNACERIDMFEPHFECVDGKVRPVEW